MRAAAQASGPHTITIDTIEIAVSCPELKGLVLELWGYLQVWGYTKIPVYFRNYLL